MSYRLRIKVENLKEEIGDYIEVPGVYSLTKACALAEEYDRTVWIIKDDVIVAEWQSRLIGWKSILSSKLTLTVDSGIIEVQYDHYCRSSLDPLGSSRNQQQVE